MTDISIHRNGAKPKPAVLIVLLATGSVSISYASEMSQSPESIDDAWWTGPLLAASPATLPRGHILIEPYIYDAQVTGQFDHSGRRQPSAGASTLGSQTYLLYGVTDSLTAGLITRSANNRPDDGPSTSGVGVGDLTAQTSFRLSSFLDGGWMPALALVIGETMPSGKYDRLGSRASDGVGAGAYSTAISIYSQYYLWMPNGRILRTRLDVTQSWSSRVAIADLSVYGTTEGFRGHAQPGSSWTVDSAWEYSVTRHWVTALDVVYVNSRSTRVVGNYTQQVNGSQMPAQVDSGSSSSLSLAPAIEYNWSGTVGVIAGLKWTAAGHNTGDSVIPVVAVNLVF